MDEMKTVLTEDVDITGSIKCSASVQMAGRLQGDLVTQGDVVIEKTAMIKGNVTGNSAVVLGQVQGNISVRERIELKSNARVVGDLRAKRLVVEDGVMLTGKTEIGSGDTVGAGETGFGEGPADADEAMRGEELDAARAARPITRDDRMKASPLFGRK